MKNIEVLRRDYVIAFHKYRKELAEKIFEVESVYWEVVFMQELYILECESVDIAKNLLLDSKARLKVGSYLPDEEEAVLEGCWLEVERLAILWQERNTNPVRPRYPR